MEKSRKLKHKKRIYLYAKIVFFVFSLVVAIWAKSDINWDNLSSIYIDCERVKDILFNVSIGVFSSMLLVFFIDDKANKLKKQEDDMLKELLTTQRTEILKQYINRYFETFYYVVTPASERMTTKSDFFDSSDFSFQQMRDLYQPSMLFGWQSAIDAFFDAELALKHQIIRYLQTAESNSEITCILNNFVNESNNYISRAFVQTEIHELALDEKDVISYISGEIANGIPEDLYKRMKNGLEVNNLLYPFVQLREMMLSEKKYLLELSKII